VKTRPLKTKPKRTLGTTSAAILQKEKRKQKEKEKERKKLLRRYQIISFSRTCSRAVYHYILRRKGV
jgi:hypothetical protein